MIGIVEEDSTTWPLVLSRYKVVASMAVGEGQIQGFGCGATAEDARHRAIGECQERYAQFGCAVPRTRIATGVALGETAISPESLGLYSDTQYAVPDFPFGRYSNRCPMEWVEVADVETQQPFWLPVEFVYPRTVSGRKPLVGETSSGTAVHPCQTTARLAAICELIERDSLMMFWHRQPPTCLLSDSSLSDLAREEIELMRGMGFVLVVCLLQYDLGIPCVLILGLRGNRFVCGAGCHPCVNHAVEHALRELGSALRWQVLEGGQSRYKISIADVEKPCDHFALYDGGPFHKSLRQALENTICLPAAGAGETITQAMPDDEALTIAVKSLRHRGYRIYECKLESAPGLSVTRMFVPGLIPMYFGFGNIRLGCRRLWSREGPGRLCTLLPHFFL
jgi:ribosomal protein S12 methylthiotransferase accessory factor